MRRSFVLLLAAALAGCAPAVPSPAPARSPNAPASAGAAVWQAIELPAPNGATVRLSDIVVSGTSVVVVGSAEGTPMAWTLGDSGTWTADALEGQMTLPYAVVAVGDRIIAIGEEQGQGCAHPGNQVVWVRDAARRWARAPFQRIFCGSGSDRAVAADGGHVVVLGVNAGEVGFTMVSDDGITWRGDDLPLDRVPTALTAGADGYVAAGRGGNGGWYGRSEDGTGWRFARLSDMPAGFEPIAVASVADGTMLWLADAEGRIAVASLRDLAGWHVAPVTDLAGVPNVSIETGQRPFFAGAGEPGSGRAFVSDDGMSWREIEVPVDGGARARLDHLVVAGDRVYAIASIPTADDVAEVLVSAPVSVLAP
jgi:hypothetical protein